MFTGIIRERGRLRAAPEPVEGGGVRIEIEHTPELSEALEIGASLAVSGVCLTVTEMRPGASKMELAPETLRRSTLGGLDAGSEVNLEPAMKLGDALGGHWVQGHVDGTVRVLSRRELGEHWEMAFSLPEELRPFVVEKGSVTLDGVSLTISGLRDDAFEVALIPHTLEVTTLGRLQPGDRVNVEVDVLAKYVQRSLEVAGRIPAAG
jgi:riboflavin synthase